MNEFNFFDVMCWMIGCTVVVSLLFHAITT